MSALLLAVLLAGTAAAQDASSPLSAASSRAGALLASSPSAVPGARSEPDDDDSVDPEDLTREPLGNFHAVADGIFRSALPSPAGYPRLKKMGFKSILNLQISSAAEERRAGPEIAVYHVAMSGLKRPSFKEMDRALEVLAAAPRPILVHCAHGKDRTGFVVAAWRVFVERKLSIAEAAAEARADGCCFILFGDLEEYLRAYGAHRRGVLLRPGL